MADPKVTAFVIGDPHFKNDQLLERKKMARKCAELIKDKKPTFIVILGDTLHYHGTTKNAPFKSVYYFIKEISNIAPVYILIGNHDYINPSQYLTDNHFFLPYRQWERVSVVDFPIRVEYGDSSFVMCPYVPPGDFKKALNELLKEGEDWQMVDCIFAHQEFRGCKEGAKVSENGDPWYSEYPPVISGHIHESQKVGKNVYYTGTPMQHSFGEKPNKKVWFVSFDVEESQHFEVEKLDLGLKGKKTLKVEFEKVDDLELPDLEKWDVKLVLVCTSDQFRAFRLGQTYRHLAKKGIKITYKRIGSAGVEGHRRTREEVSYARVLQGVVQSKSAEVQQAYLNLGGEPMKREAVIKFESDSEPDSSGSESEGHTQGSESESEEHTQSSTSDEEIELVFCDD